MIDTSVLSNAFLRFCRVQNIFFVFSDKPQPQLFVSSLLTYLEAVIDF